MKKLLFAVALTLAAGSAFACSFDLDCEIGSKCLKGRGELYGVCAGGLFPGNKYDREPVSSIFDLNDTVGDTCSFDIDCGPGSKCLKSRGAIDGVCIQRR